MGRHTGASKSTATVRAGAPLYVRLLRLKHIYLGELVCFLLFELPIGVMVITALAGFTSWWAVPLVPVTVAAMVKLNDVVAGRLDEAIRAPRRRRPAAAPVARAAVPIAGAAGATTRGASAAGSAAQVAPRRLPVRRGPAVPPARCLAVDSAPAGQAASAPSPRSAAEDAIERDGGASLEPTGQELVALLGQVRQRSEPAPQQLGAPGVEQPRRPVAEPSVNFQRVGLDGQRGGVRQARRGRADRRRRNA